MFIVCNIFITHTHIYIYIYNQLKSKVYINLAESIFYFTKIRGIIQNACDGLFSTDLNKIFHIKDVYI